MNLQLKRTNSADPDFASLVALLDADLLERYQEKQSFFNQFNKLDSIRHVVIAYADSVPIGCGAFKVFEPLICEVKRMFVVKDMRGKKVSKAILQALEEWAREEGFATAVLETGLNQPEAIALYEHSGYERIPNYGPYVGVALSVCMEKKLIA